MSYAATVIKLYPPVISSHPASFQLLLLLWHLTLPGVLLPYCDTILCCSMLFPLVFKNVFSCIYALKSNLSFPRQTVINIPCNIHTLCSWWRIFQAKLFQYTSVHYNSCHRNIYISLFLIFSIYISLWEIDASLTSLRGE